MVQATLITEAVLATLNWITADEAPNDMLAEILDIARLAPLLIERQKRAPAVAALVLVEGHVHGKRHRCASRRGLELKSVAAPISGTALARRDQLSIPAIRSRGRGSSIPTMAQLG